MVDTRKIPLDEDYDWFVKWYEDRVKQGRAEKAPTIESRIRELGDSILELEKQLQAKTAEASVARQYQCKAEDLINKLSSKDPIDGVIEWFEDTPATDDSTDRLRKPCDFQGPSGVKGTNGVRFHGNVGTLRDLPSIGSQGDLYYVEYDRRMYTWEPLSKTWLEYVDSYSCQEAYANASLTVFPSLYLGENTAVPIDPIRDLDSYDFIKYLHEASPGELESGTITERTLSRISGNHQT